MNIVNPNLNFRDLKALALITQPQKLIQHHMGNDGSIYAQHNNHLSRGWNGLAYNYWIAFDGTIFEGRGFRQGAHSGATWNPKSLGIGYQGDFENGVMTDAQLESGARLNAWLIKQFPYLTLFDIIGHKDVTATLCPGKNFRMGELRTRTLDYLSQKNEIESLRKEVAKLQSEVNRLTAILKSISAKTREFI